MPELPEVYTITSDLKRTIENTVIWSVETYGDYKIEGTNVKNSKELNGAEITKVARIAKNIIFKLSSGKYIRFHLAMTGRLLLKKDDKTMDPHTRVDFMLKKDGGNYMILRFCDMRMFGKVTLMSKEALKDLTEKYGPEPIDGKLTSEDFHQAISGKNTSIKNLLLDQSFVAGIGNIYANEALWEAGIHPKRKASSMKIQETQKLLESLKKSLLDGINHRGSTLPDEAYVDIFEKPGFHQNYFKIYGKKDCVRCGAKIEYMKLNGRGTYVCSFCQKNET